MPFVVWLRYLAAQKLLQFHRYFLATAQRDAGREAVLEGDPSGGGPAADLAADNTSPGSAAIQVEERDLVHAAMGKLGEADREVLTLCYLEQLSYAEAAEVIGIEADAVKQRCLRALRRLAEVLRTNVSGLESPSHASRDA